MELTSWKRLAATIGCSNGFTADLRSVGSCMPWSLWIGLAPYPRHQNQHECLERDTPYKLKRCARAHAEVAEDEQAPRPIARHAHLSPRCALHKFAAASRGAYSCISFRSCFRFTTMTVTRFCTTPIIAFARSWSRNSAG